MKTCDVAIIGAGPYGLSIAAHLKARGVQFRIFGSPMHTWLSQMPRDMQLKSEGFASSLYDPGSEFTLSDYCGQAGISYADIGLPVKLETFTSYGIAFQKRFVPEVENKMVVSIRRSSSDFEVSLDDGETFTAKKVVVASGIGYFGYVPPVLAALSDEFVTHSSKHSVLDAFKGRDVVVVGAGASALDLVALLHEAGASVQLVARKPLIRFHDPPKIPKPLLDRLRFPNTGIGPGWRLLFYCSAPLVFHCLPKAFRLEAVRLTLGPAPGWFIKHRVVGKLPLNLACTITNADVRGNRVALRLKDSNGSERTLLTDHVIAATGYKVDLRRLPFLDSEMLQGIQVIDQAPVLNSNFESSVPGLYFVGTSSANSFGPVMRFAFGAGFTAKRLSAYLAKKRANEMVQTRVVPGAQALEQS